MVVCSGSLWLFIVVLWWFVVVDGGLWWFTVVCRCLWWFEVVCGSLCSGSRSFVVVLW